MISGYISRASAAVLLVGGIAFLFAPDVILPRLVPGFPASGAWLGQLVAAGWLALAALNWYSRRTVIGGIYGRTIVTANTLLYFVTAMVLFTPVTRSDTPAALWILAVPVGLFAGIYGWLLFRGPFTRDLERRA